MFSSRAVGSLAAFSLLFIDIGLFLQPDTIPSILLVIKADSVLNKPILTEHIPLNLSYSLTHDESI